jgi:hypothetical protein
MTRRATSSLLLVLAAAAFAGAGGCYNAVDQASETHAAETRSRDDQAEKIRAKDEKSGPKDTTTVVGRDSVKVDGG